MDLSKAIIGKLLDKIISRADDVDSDSLMNEIGDHSDKDCDYETEDGDTSIPDSVKVIKISGKKPSKDEDDDLLKLFGR